MYPVRIDPSGCVRPDTGSGTGPKVAPNLTGMYVPVPVSPMVEQRIVEHGVRLRSGAVTGWAALRLWGGGYFTASTATGVRRFRSSWPEVPTG